MHEHGPNCREGPIRGSRAWWRGLAPQTESFAQPATTTRNEAVGMEDTNIRHEIIARVRREIAAGTYDTPEKWEAALDRLGDSLRSD